MAAYGATNERVVGVIFTKIKPVFTTRRARKLDPHIPLPHEGGPTGCPAVEPPTEQTRIHLIAECFGLSHYKKKDGPQLVRTVFLCSRGGQGWNAAPNFPKRQRANLVPLRD